MIPHVSAQENAQTVLLAADEQAPAPLHPPEHGEGHVACGSEPDGTGEHVPRFGPTLHAMHPEHIDCGLSQQ